MYTIKCRGSPLVVCYRRMLQIEWMDRITKEKVVGRIREERALEDAKGEKSSEYRAFVETRRITERNPGE